MSLLICKYAHRRWSTAMVHAHMPLARGSAAVVPAVSQLHAQLVDAQPSALSSSSFLDVARPLPLLGNACCPLRALACFEQPACPKWVDLFALLWCGGRAVALRWYSRVCTSLSLRVPMRLQALVGNRCISVFLLCMGLGRLVCHLKLVSHAADSPRITSVHQFRNSVSQASVIRECGDEGVVYIFLTALKCVGVFESATPLE